VAGKSISHHHHHHDSVWNGEAGGGAYGDTGITEIGRAMGGGVQRYRNNGDRMSDGEYIFGRPRAR